MGIDKIPVNISGFYFQCKNLINIDLLDPIAIKEDSLDFSLNKRDDLIVNQIIWFQFRFTFNFVFLYNTGFIAKSIKHF